MKKVAQRLSKLKMNEEERANYYKYMKEVVTQRDAISTAEARGKAEKATNIALRMLKKRISIEDISEFTGLPIAEIKELQKTIHI
jgi:predicted transposase YdaD